MQEDRIDWRLLALFFALGCAFYITRTLNGTGPLLDDPDDAMRLVTLRDLLAGQNWYDHIQHRMNTPFGAEMHWSRLVDLPMALLLAALRPAFGSMAETILAYIWPLALLLVLLWLTALLALRLAGRDAVLPALVLPVVSMVAMTEFTPGRLDHHAIQILLMLALVILTVDALHKPTRALWAGLTAATALAIGIESLPGVAATILAFGVIWVVRPDGGRAAFRFGLAFALAALAHLVIALPPDQWFVPACDALSLTYVSATLLAGLGFMGLAMLPLRQPRLRLAAGLGTGLCIVAILATAFPECLKGPYAALDPWLVSNWLDRITEVKPYLSALRSDPVYATANGLPLLLALVAIPLHLRFGPASRHAAWWIFGGTLLVLTLVMLAQIRGARLALPLAMPAIAALIVFVRSAWQRSGNPVWIAPLLVAWLGGAGLIVALATHLLITNLPGLAPVRNEAAAMADNACRMPGAFAALAELPPQRIMAPIDLGSHLLAFTPHEVVAAPYHRNVDGVRDTFRFLNDDPDTARAILVQRGIDLVVICQGMPELAGTADRDPRAISVQLAAGDLPGWLVPMGDPEAPLRLYRFDPGSVS